MEFATLNHQIQEYLDKHPPKESALTDDHYKLPLSDALFCAQDTIRNQMFFKAIASAVELLKSQSRSITVIDAGSGVGLLGLYALYSGADECLFLENNPYTLEYSRGLLDYFGYYHRSRFIECDATKVQLPKNYDMLISETITSGFVEEDFLSIIQHLRPFAHKKAIVIPESFDVAMIQKDKKGRELGRKEITINSYHFSGQPDFKKDYSHEVFSVTYETKAHLFDGFSLESGQCMSFLNERTVFV